MGKNYEYQYTFQMARVSIRCHEVKKNGTLVFEYV